MPFTPALTQDARLQAEGGRRLLGGSTPVAQMGETEAQKEGITQPALGIGGVGAWEGSEREPPGPRLMPGPPQIVQYIELCRYLLNSRPGVVLRVRIWRLAAASASPSGLVLLAASTSPRWPSSMGPAECSCSLGNRWPGAAPGWGRSGPHGRHGRRRRGGLPAWRAVAGAGARLATLDCPV